MLDHESGAGDREEPGKGQVDTLFAQQVWEEFFPRLAGLARKKLDAIPRRVVDEEDVALSAINSFFNGYKEGRFRIEERDDMWRLLATIAARKSIAHQRRFFSQQRGAGAVRGESVFEVNGDAAFSGLERIQDLNQMPELPDQVFSTCEELLNSLKNENLRTTAIMKMQGYSHQEISDHLNCSVARTKQRVASIRKQWHAVLGSQE